MLGEAIRSSMRPARVQVRPEAPISMNSESRSCSRSTTLQRTAGSSSMRSADSTKSRSLFTRQRYPATPCRRADDIVMPDGSWTFKDRYLLDAHVERGRYTRED